MKIKLKNGCSHSQLSVIPKNWKNKNASLKTVWVISYRYYDPRFPKPKQVMIKGMNPYKTIAERQEATQKLLNEVLVSLEKGFNPFDKENESLAESMFFIDALKAALTKITVAECTTKELLGSIVRFEKAINALNYQDLLVSEISRKHIRLILDKCSNTDDRFNKHRSYMMILLSVLCELEIVSTNFVRDIKKRKVIKHIRLVLTDEERVLVNEYLFEYFPEFHRFLHIFFHSGARISELLRVKDIDIDFKNQRFRLLIQKGSNYREVWRQIKTVALPYWEEQMKTCKENDFVFSKGLMPGVNQIQPYQINKRWYRHVKKKFNIKADFYSLKHLHTTEVVEMINSNEAALHNGHTSTDMVNKVYDIRRVSRNQKNIIDLDNKFA